MTPSEFAELKTEIIEALANMPIRDRINMGGTTFRTWTNPDEFNNAKVMTIHLYPKTRNGSVRMSLVKANLGGGKRDEKGSISYIANERVLDERYDLTEKQAEKIMSLYDSPVAKAG